MFKIVCEFDNTIAVTNVVEDLLNEFASPAWHLLARDRDQGRINAQQCLARQIAMVRAQPHQLTRFFHYQVIDFAFPAFAEFCALRDLSLVVVSDGFEMGIRQILARHTVGHLPIVANRLEQCGADRWTATFPARIEYCSTGTGVCLCTAANGGPLPIVLIGEGPSTMCFAQHSDLVLAKGRLQDYCVAQHIPHLQVSDFTQVLLIFQQLLSHPWDVTEHKGYYH